MIISSIGLIIVLIIALKYNKVLKEVTKEVEENSKKMKEVKSESNIDLESDVQEVLNFIKKQDGRTTQKDIRKAFPSSEAKISLMKADIPNLLNLFVML